MTNYNQRQLKDRNEKRGEKNFCFHEKKENIVCSLNEVEHFLCNFKKVIKGVELYKLLKW